MSLSFLSSRLLSPCRSHTVERSDKGFSHDDITYESIGKAFNLPLILNEDAYARMKKLSKPHPSQPNFSWDVDSPARQAKLRMVILPTDEARDQSKQFLFPHDDLWVPVNVVNGNVHILPGVPRLCRPVSFFHPPSFRVGFDLQFANPRKKKSKSYSTDSSRSSCPA